VAAGAKTSCNLAGRQANIGTWAPSASWRWQICNQSDLIEAAKQVALRRETKKHALM
jgi:hypothetical protein